MPSLRVGLPQFLFFFKESWETICYKTRPTYEFSVRGQEKAHSHRPGLSPRQLSVFVTSGEMSERVHTDFQKTDVTSIKEKNRLLRGNLVSIFLKHLF